VGVKRVEKAKTTKSGQSIHSESLRVMQMRRTPTCVIVVAVTTAKRGLARARKVLGVSVLDLLLAAQHDGEEMKIQRLPQEMTKLRLTFVAIMEVGVAAAV
jgi:hypothetical protein